MSREELMAAILKVALGNDYDDIKEKVEKFFSIFSDFLGNAEASRNFLCYNL